MGKTTTTKAVAAAAKSNDNRSALLDGFPKSWLDNKLLDLWVLFSILVGSVF